MPKFTSSNTSGSVAVLAEHWPVEWPKCTDTYMMTAPAGPETCAAMCRLTHLFSCTLLVSFQTFVCVIAVHLTWLLQRRGSPFQVLWALLLQVRGWLGSIPGRQHLEDGLQLASWLQCVQLAASHGGSLRTGCLLQVQAQPLPQAAPVEDKEAGEGVQKDDPCCPQWRDLGQCSSPPAEVRSKHFPRGLSGKHTLKKTQLPFLVYI